MYKLSYLLFVLVILGEWVALAKKPDFAQIPGYNEARARLNQVRSEEVNEKTRSMTGIEFRNNGVKIDDIGTFLQYNAAVKKSVVSLDFEDSVEDVECGLNVMTITQRVTGNEHKFLTGEYITASPLWNCGEVGPVYRNITQVVSVDYSADGKMCVTVVLTNIVQFMDLFERVAAKTIETDIAEKISNEAKNSIPDNSERMLSVRDEEVLITEPNQYSQYNSSMDVEVSWVYHTQDQSIGLQLYLVDKNGNENPVSNCNWNGRLSQNSCVFPKTCFELNKRYKISLSYSGTSVSSQVFAYAEPSMDHSLNVYKPEYGASFNSGDTITVQWESYKWDSDAKINVYLYREETFSDTKLFEQQNVLVSSKQFQFTIPRDVGSGRMFYIYIGYDCGTFWCSEGFYSKLFALNFDPPFEITNELRDDTIYFPGYDRTVTWDILKNVDYDAEIIVRLKEDYPSIFPIPDKTITQVKAKAGDKQAVLHPERGSKYPVYYEIAYDCNWFGTSCSTVASQIFSMVEFNKISWNRDENGKVKEEQLECANFGCDSMCKANSNGDSSMFCKACDAGVEMSVSATCENCQALVRAGFYGLNLEFVGSDIQLFEVGFYGRAELDVSLKLEVSAEITKEKVINLLDLSFSPFGFYIGSVPIGLTLNLRFDIPLKLEMKASVEALIKTAGIVKVFAYARYGNRIPVDQRGVTVITRTDSNSTTKPTFEFNAYAEATLSAALRASVVSSFIHVIDLNAYAEVVGTAHGDLQKFDARSEEKLYPQTLKSYGSCLNPHLLEYYLRLSADAHAEATFLFAQTELMKKDYQYPYSYILLSGCLLSWTPSNDKEKSYSMVYNVSGLSRSRFSCSDEILNLGIAKEICDTTKWPKGSLIAEVINDDGNITGINFTLRPIASNGGYQTSSENELKVTLKDKLSKSNAAFYSGSVGRYFKDMFSDIEVVTVFSSSSFINPSFFLLGFIMLLIVAM